MKKNLSKVLALILSLALLFSANIFSVPLGIEAVAENADSGDIDYSNFSGRQTWKFDTAPENEDFQINMLNAAVDTANGYFYAPTNWTQNQPVNYEFKNGKTYVVNIKWKVSAKPSGGIKFYLRYGTSAAGYNAIGSSTSWIATPPTDWRTDRYQFTASKTGLLNVYMDAGNGETLYIDTISVYEVGSSVRFDFSDDTQLKAKYQDTNNGYSVELTNNNTVSTKLVSQWSTGCQFVPDYILESGKKYTVTYRYKADVSKPSNTFAVNYNTGAGAWNSYDTAAGFQTPSVKTTAANTWYTGSFEFVAANDDAHPYLGIALRPTLPGNYEFDDITISQTTGTVILDTMDGNTQNLNITGANVGSSVELPAPTRTCYNFVGWYSENTLENQVTSVTVPDAGETVTVYAKWEIITEYSLDFEDGNDLEIADSWFNGDGCKPQISDGKLSFKGSKNNSASSARLPIALETGKYYYSFEYSAEPIAQDGYTLYFKASSNTATDNSTLSAGKTIDTVFNNQDMTAQETKTRTGTIDVTADMLRDTANKLTLVFKPSNANAGAMLYIDNFTFEKHDSCDEFAVTDEAVEATCTTTGKTEGSHCSKCGRVITAQQTVPVKSHSIVHHEAKEATCTEIGWNAYDTCSNCDYTTYVEIPAKGHTEAEPVIENLVAPSFDSDSKTYTDGSYDEVVYCSVCHEELSRETKTLSTENYSVVKDLGSLLKVYTQTNKTTNSIRIITLLDDDIDVYGQVGFKISIDGGDTYERSVNTVYTSLINNGNTLLASAVNENAKYFVILTMYFGDEKPTTITAQPYVEFWADNNGEFDVTLGETKSINPTLLLG